MKTIIGIICILFSLAALFAILFEALLLLIIWLVVLACLTGIICILTEDSKPSHKP